MIYVIAIVVFFIVGIITMSSSMFGFILVFGGLALSVYIGIKSDVSSETAESYAPIVVGAIIGFIFGMLSRIMDKLENAKERR
ncbi:hypothetical protein [Paenibacillus sp. NEAU-GSW1]|uniref:hypothetical protein n=1 Tax=Paenibacillus sp. NEAU-GSW1 TaxID=2682486 RepID=UPI0012E2D042|nr:hypothetical protein [Paenibacillus sp. NEAU-GSW1]MUT65529.1 hypothetical protein [Paenibacillus sp. NEAU-GSW1]